MGHFVPQKTVQVTHPDFPGEYIAIKAKFSLADRNRITGAMVALNDQRQMDVDMGAYFNLILELAITNWKLYARDPDTDEIVYEGEGDNKKPVEIPYKKEYIQDFDPDDPLIDEVMKKIAELNPTLLGSTTNT